MTEIIGRWQAGHSDWLPIPPYEIILEQIPPKWLLTYLVFGERQAFIGFDTEEEARRNVIWLKTRCPVYDDDWIDLTPQIHDS